MSDELMRFFKPNKQFNYIDAYEIWKNYREYALKFSKDSTTPSEIK